jgi:hypothetical protein
MDAREHVIIVVVHHQHVAVAGYALIRQRQDHGTRRAGR